MGRTGMKSLTIKKEGFEITLEHKEGSNHSLQEFPLDMDETPQRYLEAESKRNLSFAKADRVPAPLAEAPATEAAPGNFVTSPMVGTFYTSPAPDDPPFAKIGDKVTKKTVLCIIEAMKVMNEITAGVDGTVAEVFIETGHPVEFGTKLFRIT